MKLVERQELLATISERRGEIYRYVHRFVSNEADAEDATQEVFLRLCETIEHYNSEKAPLYQWALIIARTQVDTRLKWGMVRRKTFGDAGLDLVPINDDPLRRLVTLEEKSLLGAAVSCLPRRQREALTLYLQNVPQKEIATQLHMAYGNAGSHIYEAKQNIIQMLSES